MTGLAEELSTSLKVHTLNFSGHGGLEFKSEFSIAAFADEVFEYMLTNSLTNVSVFGYSMGGYVAMYLAKHYSGHFDKVITLATKYHWDAAIAAREASMLNPDAIIEKLPAFALQLKERHHPNDWRQVLARTKQLLVALGNDNAMKEADFKEINASCLLLLGEKDKMVTLEETRDVQHLIRGAKLQVLPQTAHPVEQVDVVKLGAIIKDFVEHQ